MGFIYPLHFFKIHDIYLDIYNFSWNCKIVFNDKINVLIEKKINKKLYIYIYINAYFIEQYGHVFFYIFLYMSFPVAESIS